MALVDSPRPDTSGFRVRDLAGRWCVSQDKIRRWINNGELRAINVATNLCGRPRWVITRESVAAFEHRRTSGPPPQRKRRRLRQKWTDYYADSEKT
jgi:hypothetical protein